MIFGLSISAVSVVVTFVGVCFTLSAITPFLKKLLFGRDTFEKMFDEKWRRRRQIVATRGDRFRGNRYCWSGNRYCCPVDKCYSKEIGGDV